MASPVRVGDQAIINLNGIILPSEIQKEFSGLAAVYSPATDTECWYYKLTNITTSSTNLISEDSFLSKGGLTRGTDAGTSSNIVSPADKVKFLFIVHTGYRGNSGSSTEESIYMTISGNTAAYNSADAIEIGSSECWYGKMNNTTVSDINVISGTKAGGGTGSNTIASFVVAIIEDV
tara:strand:- start:1047 stop:1577 length:531 start_codon:yes stop_codon:yes gene_type:complete